jgi:hypothetical protein
MWLRRTFVSGPRRFHLAGLFILNAVSPSHSRAQAPPRRGAIGHQQRPPNELEIHPPGKDDIQEFRTFVGVPSSNSRPSEDLNPLV